MNFLGAALHLIERMCLILFLVSRCVFCVFVVSLICIFSTLCIILCEFDVVIVCIFVANVSLLFGLLRD
jgi:hypothetical protein